MTAETHRQFSISWSFVAAMLLYKYGLSGVNYYLAVCIMLMASRLGALFPDLDHHWGAIKEKNIPNYVISKLIHLTGGKHRSWQTHSIDITLVLCVLSYYLPAIAYRNGILNKVDAEIAMLILMGFMCGWLSHIVADMLTSGGVRVLCFMGGLKLALVPKKLLWTRFNTAGAWEHFVYIVSRAINCIAGVLCLIYPTSIMGRVEPLTRLF